MDRYRLGTETTLVLDLGDLTCARVDAIVNAANESLLGGGGVDGAIHRAAGSELLRACREIPEVASGVRCPTGDARITPGFALPAPFVIHTVGPVYGQHPKASALLASAHRRSLEVARANDLRTIAFPAISCGVYGYPLDEAAAVAIASCEAHAAGIDEVWFVLFSGEALDAWRRAAGRLAGA